MQIFANATELETPAKVSHKAKKMAELPLEGTKDFAALDFLKKTIESLHRTCGADLKSAATIEHVRVGTLLGRKPDTFRAVEPTVKGETQAATSQCQLRAKSSSDALPEASITLLREHNIKIAEKKNVADTYVINPVYFNDSALLELVSKALADVPGLPTDFIKRQTATTTYHLTETSVDEVFALAKQVDAETEKPVISPIEVKALLDVVSTIALVPNFGSTDIKLALQIVGDLIPELAAAKAEPKKVEPAKEAALAATLRASIALENKVRKGSTKKAA